MSEDRTAAIGFIGLGVMGEPMCRNLARKSGRRVVGFDRVPEPLERLRVFGVTAADSISALAAACDVIFMALPSGRHVKDVCEGADGLLANTSAGSLVVDLG